jgi:hypothetical protein
MMQTTIVRTSAYSGQGENRQVSYTKQGLLDIVIVQSSVHEKSYRHAHVATVPMH